MVMEITLGHTYRWHATTETYRWHATTEYLLEVTELLLYYNLYFSFNNTIIRSMALKIFVY